MLTSKPYFGQNIKVSLITHGTARIFFTATEYPCQMTHILLLFPIFNGHFRKLIFRKYQNYTILPHA
jgi:hypothetical protein